MFMCDKCKRITQSGEKQYKVVVEKRPKTYNNNGNISCGWEIVKELKVCGDCKSIG